MDVLYCVLACNLDDNRVSGHCFVLDDVVQCLEGLLAIEDGPTLFVLAYKDAALGVVGIVSNVDEDTLISWNVDEARNEATTYLLVEWHIAEPIGACCEINMI